MKNVVTGIVAMLMFIFMASADNSPVKAVVGMLVCLMVLFIIQRKEIK